MSDPSDYGFFNYHCFQNQYARPKKVVARTEHGEGTSAQPDRAPPTSAQVQYPSRAILTGYEVPRTSTSKKKSQKVKKVPEYYDQYWNKRFKIDERNVAVRTELGEGTSSQPNYAPSALSQIQYASSATPTSYQASRPPTSKKKSQNVQRETEYYDPYWNSQLKIREKKVVVRPAFGEETSSQPDYVPPTVPQIQYSSSARPRSYEAMWPSTSKKKPQKVQRETEYYDPYWNEQLKIREKKVVVRAPPGEGTSSQPDYVPPTFSQIQYSSSARPTSYEAFWPSTSKKKSQKAKRATEYYVPDWTKRLKISDRDVVVGAELGEGTSSQPDNVPPTLSQNQYSSSARPTSYETLWPSTSKETSQKVAIEYYDPNWSQWFKLEDKDIKIRTELGEGTSSQPDCVPPTSSQVEYLPPASVTSYETLRPYATKKKSQKVYRKNVAEYYDPYWSKQLKRGEKVVVVRTPLGERTASQRNYAAPTSSQVQQRRHTSLAGYKAAQSYMSKKKPQKEKNVPVYYNRFWSKKFKPGEKVVVVRTELAEELMSQAENAASATSQGQHSSHASAASCEASQPPTSKKSEKVKEVAEKYDPNWSTQLNISEENVTRTELSEGTSSQPDNVPSTSSQVQHWSHASAASHETSQPPTTKKSEKVEEVAELAEYYDPNWGTQLNIIEDDLARTELGEGTSSQPDYVPYTSSDIQYWSQASPAIYEELQPPTSKKKSQKVKKAAEYYDPYWNQQLVTGEKVVVVRTELGEGTSSQPDYVPSASSQVQHWSHASAANYEASQSPTSKKSEKTEEVAEYYDPNWCTQLNIIEEDVARTELGEVISSQLDYLPYTSPEVQYWSHASPAIYEELQPTTSKKKSEKVKKVAEYYDPYWSQQLVTGEKVVVVRTELGEGTSSQPDYVPSTSSQVQHWSHTSAASYDASQPPTSKNSEEVDEVAELAEYFDPNWTTQLNIIEENLARTELGEGTSSQSDYLPYTSSEVQSWSHASPAVYEALQSPTSKKKSQKVKKVAEYSDPYWSKQLVTGEKVVVVRTELGEGTSSQPDYVPSTSSQVQHYSHASAASYEASQPLTSKKSEEVEDVAELAEYFDQNWSTQLNIIEDELARTELGEGTSSQPDYVPPTSSEVQYWSYASPTSYEALQPATSKKKSKKKKKVAEYSDPYWSKQLVTGEKVVAVRTELGEGTSSQPDYVPPTPLQVQHSSSASPTRCEVSQPSTSKKKSQKAKKVTEYYDPDWNKQLKVSKEKVVARKELGEGTSSQPDYVPPTSLQVEHSSSASPTRCGVSQPSTSKKKSQKASKEVTEYYDPDWTKQSKISEKKVVDKTELAESASSQTDYVPPASSEAQYSSPASPTSDEASQPSTSKKKSKKAKKVTEYYDPDWSKQLKISERQQYTRKQKDQLTEAKMSTKKKKCTKRQSSKESKATEGLKRVSESSDLEQKSMKFDQRFYQHQQIVRKPDRLKPKKLKTEFVEGRSCLQTTQQVYRPGTPLATLILDSGGHTIKMGLSTDSDPTIIPNAIMKVKSEKKRLFIGNQIEECRDLSGLYFLLPCERGYVTKWEVQKPIWDYAFNKGISIEDRCVVMTQPLFNFKCNQDCLDELFFEDYDVKAMYRANPTDFSKFEYCRRFLKTDEPCLVVDSGFSFTHVVPYIDDRKYYKGVKRINVGGKFLTNYLRDVISYRMYDVMEETYVINQVKEDCAFVAMNVRDELKKAKLPPGQNPISINYVLPDFNMIRRGYIQNMNRKDEIAENCQILRLNNERFTVPELLFHPRDVGMTSVGVAEAIAKSIMTCPLETRSYLAKNIIITGGNARIQGFEERLLNDVRSFLPSSYIVKTYKPDDPVTYAWKGGKSLAIEPSYKKFMVTKQEYEEYGSKITYERFNEWVSFASEDEEPKTNECIPLSYLEHLKNTDLFESDKELPEERPMIVEDPGEGPSHRSDAIQPITAGPSEENNAPFASTVAPEDDTVKCTETTIHNEKNMNNTVDGNNEENDIEAMIRDAEMDEVMECMKTYI